MAKDFDACLDFTLREEDGFCDNPDDPGGAASHGITLTTLRHWADDPGLGVQAIRSIPIRTCRAIYRSAYWHGMRCDAMPAGVDLMLFDHGVNAGPARSVRLLQQAMDFSAAACDGCVGPVTIGGADKADPKTLIDRMADLQAAYYRRLPTFAKFGRGWFARADRRAHVIRQPCPAPISSITAASAICHPPVRDAGSRFGCPMAQLPHAPRSPSPASTWHSARCTFTGTKATSVPPSSEMGGPMEHEARIRRFRSLTT